MKDIARHVVSSMVVCPGGNNARLARGHRGRGDDMYERRASQWCIDASGGERNARAVNDDDLVEFFHQSR